MNETDLSEMGPIDYVLIEWPDRQPDGRAVPHLVDLVDRGIIRLLDLTFITENADAVREKLKELRAAA